MNIESIAKEIIKLKDNENIAKSYWVTLTNKTGTAEGKIHIPHKNNDTLMIFEPGFPGGGSGYFEELLLEQVLKDGISAFVIRHVGTIINGEHSDSYIVCKEKQTSASKKNQIVTGTKKSHTITDWLVEPKIALEILAPHYNKIIFVGHSFGPLAGFTSLIDFVEEVPKYAKRIKRFISMAGTLGIARDPEGRMLSQWEEYLEKDWSKERVLIGDTIQNKEILHKAYQKVHKNTDKFPDHIDFIAIHPWGDEKYTTDELVPIEESLDIITSLERGFLIVDKLEVGDENQERIAHDMQNLKPAFFSKVMNLEWLPKSQISVLR
ncbi:hypothetical protein ACFL1Q_02490 [Patescibacteria group bacterium]